MKLEWVLYVIGFVKLEWVLYVIGFAAAACAGFFSPAWYLGFLPIAFGSVWAAYDLIGEPHESAQTPRRSR